MVDTCYGCGGVSLKPALTMAAGALKAPFTAIARAEATERWCAAAATGSLSIVQKYLRKGHPIDSRGPYGKTALFFAAANNHIAVIRLLIDHGASPSMADAGLDNDTPLHAATFKGHIEVVRLLLEAGGNLYHVNAHGRTPYDIAAQGLCREGRLVSAQLASLYTAAGGGRIALGMMIATGQLPPTPTPAIAPVGGDDTGGVAGHHRIVVLTAPPGSSEGDLFLIRTADGGEHRIATPAHAAGTDRPFAVQIPATPPTPPPPPPADPADPADPAAAAADAVDEDAEPPSQQPQATGARRVPRYGRPIGVRLAVNDASLREMVSLERCSLDCIDELDAWLRCAGAGAAVSAGAGVGAAAAVCRRCAFVLVMRGIRSPQELAAAPAGTALLRQAAGALLSEEQLVAIEGQLREL